MTRTCIVEGCDKPFFARHRCKIHYDRAYHGGEFVVRRINPGPCKIEGCERRKVGRGLCAAHWKRWRRHGDPLTPPKVNLYSADELRRLNLCLDSIPPGGRAGHREVVDLTLILGRTTAAVSNKLNDLRHARREAEPA